MMRTIRKSKLLKHSDPNKLNTLLQETLNEFNEEGLIVSIEDVFSNSARKTGSGNYSSELFSFILVVGYDQEEVK